MHGAIAAKILWREGMHLAQHHFQSQSRYVEDCIATALSQSFFTPYGVAGCELDRDALRNGTAALIFARGLMPDGTPFQMPDGDPLPPPRDIRDTFSPATDSHKLLLTLPAYKPNSANLAADNNGARFRPISTVQRDDLTGTDEKSVTLAGRNFRLILDSEAGEDAIALPVALVRRDGKGGFQYDTDYIPPSLQIGSCEPLAALVQRIVDVLDSRGDAIASNRGSAGPAEFASREVANFWLLHAIRSAVAVLRHQAAARRIHPEQVYVELARLSGALCTFALESHPRDLPLYNHEDLAGCLGQLHDHIRAHLELIVPNSLVTVPLALTGPSLHTGAIPDRRAFEDASWILGIRADIGAADLIGRVPRLVKMCSAKFTMELVKRQFPGLTLTHLPVPPSPIVPRGEMQYFSVTRSGPCWDTLRQTNEAGVYVPDALPNASVELSIILGSP
ncbi:MAG TPA: type VI secretion system baseplate subunit TssK [Gemmatimonadaceae bacterium]|nr:type VI secretion system baseplate subunit TssK [Gemmatimonadaceae bacterium]